MPESAPQPSPSDADLVGATLAGDREAFRGLVERHQKRVFLAALRIAGDRDEAEDLAQETFLKAYTQLGRYNPQWAFSTWIATIATRTALNASRSKQSRSRLASAELERAIRPAPPPAPFADEERRQSLDRLREELTRLGGKMKLFLEWHHLEGFSIAKIAGLAGESPGAVKTALHRARRALRERLAPPARPIRSEEPEHESKS